MRKWAVGIVLLGACSSHPPSSPPPNDSGQERAVRNAFEAWRGAILAGKVEHIFAGMSTMMVSEWMYQRMADPTDTELRKHRPRLQGPASDDLDVWYVDNRSRNPERPSRLPASILTNPWLFEVFKAYYEPFKEAMKDLYKNCEVAAVYVDETGATVVVRNKVINASDRYFMVIEGTWKVDGHKEPGLRLPK